MLRRPIVWTALLVTSLICTVLTYKYFSQAFPVVTLDLQMDRSNSLRSAAELASRFAWGPAGYEQTASFGLDSQVQTFVELECGGTDAFATMLREGPYSPYTWRVRHFKEGETRETMVWFTAEGKPYGFAEKLAEDMPGLSLTTEAARDIAETSALEDWQLDLASYKLVEESQENRPGGRTDHSFVYERVDVQLGEGRYRLRLVVGGNRLTELTHFVKIPESFSRRYDEMRSANDTIATVAQVAVAVLYLIGGCIIGLFFLLRQRWVTWRTALFWGLFIAFLQLLAGLNALPLAWMQYDTALSSQGFLLDQIIQQLASFLFLACLLTLSFMGAENLSRKAFPQHVQLWKIWSNDVASSPVILRQTVLGYLGVSIFFAYEVALYFLSQKYFGWWSPSSALFEPNTLATYLPWLTSIANSAQAGFWEECLFRAVPIAGAALLGQRFGHKKIWILSALILQAVVFGAGHANYPAQPAYARLAELVIPSIGLGLVYIGFGLLPAVILHFAYDVVWFALPLFVSSTSGIWWDRSLVILLSLVPLWIVLLARVRRGQWGTLSSESLNASWKPPPPVQPELGPSPADVLEARQVIAPLTRKVLPIAGALGLLSWFATSDFTNYAPSLPIERSEVGALAKDLLTEKGIELSDTWKTMSTVEIPLSQNDRFVWQTGGKEVYKKLIGTYLGPPFWKVRFARFVGDVAERAEEFEVFVTGSGQIIRFRHQLPEASPGAVLSEEEARAIADEMIREKYQLDPHLLKLVSSEPSRLPERRDWLFTYSDVQGYPLSEGEARLRIEISGDKVVDGYRFVYVPQEWDRRERSERTIPGILEMSCQALLVLLVIAGAITAIVSWSRKAFSTGTFLVVFVVFACLRLVGVANSWPSVNYAFRTAEPLINQLIMIVLASLLGAFVVSAVVALVVGLIHHWNHRYSLSSVQLNLAYGVFLGTALVGLATGLEALAPSLVPVWANYSPAGRYLPLLETSLGPILSYITQCTVILFIVASITILTDSWRRRRWLGSIILILLGLVVVGSGGIDTIWVWPLVGGLVGLAFLLAFRFVFLYKLALVLPTIATMLIFELAEEATFRAYPAALTGMLLAIFLVAGISYYWFKQLVSGERQAN